MATDGTLLQPLECTLFDYERKDGKLYPWQLKKRPLPELLIQPSKCSSNCQTKACCCKKSQLNCISLCKYINDCQNKKG